MNKKSNQPQTLTVTSGERTSWGMNQSLEPRNMVTMVSEIDASALERLREEVRASGRKVPSYTALVIKAASLTMAANPTANRAILGPPGFRKLVQFHNTDISVAVEKSLPYLPGQAFAMPIKDSLEKPTADITAELQALATCDESNNESYKMFMRILRWLPAPLGLFLINLPYWFPKLWVRHRGCAAWVNAPSKAGADLVMTTWPWPLTFSFGKVKTRPWIVDDKVEARKTMPVVLVFDRRIMGGGPASRLFEQFKEILEDADLYLTESETMLRRRMSASQAKDLSQRETL